MTRICERCGSSDLRSVQKFGGYWRKECAECGSTGPFVVPEPDPDWQRDFDRDSRASEREDVEAQKGTG